MEELDIPEQIQSFVPESEIYKDLLNFERRLDDFTSQKKQSMKHLLAQTQNIHETLRIFVISSVDEEKKLVTLHVQGHLLDEQGQIIENGRLFTSFLKKAYFEFDKEVLSEDPTEWSRTQGFKDVDGFALTRDLTSDCHVHIFLFLKDDPARFYCSKQLSHLLDFDETISYTLNSVLNALWNYVKIKNLQDSNDKKIINNDERLSELFGTTKMNFSEIISKVREHLKPIEPIEIEYTMRLDDSKSNEIFLDVDLDLEEPIQSEITSFLSDEPSKEIIELNLQVRFYY